MANVYGYPDFVKSTGFGSVTGLKGANCYHDFWPFLPGIQKPNYSESQLAEMNKSITEKRTYNGREYTLYEATQRQRYLERCMRARADQVHLMELGGAAEADLTAVKARYRTYSQEYAAFSKAMGLPQQRERVTAGRDMLSFQPPAQDDKPPANPPTGTPTNPPTGTAVSMDIGLPNPKSTGSYGDYQTGHQIPPKGLTNGGNRAKMDVEYDSIELFKGADALTEQDAKTLDEAVSVIPANLLQKLSEHVAGIEIVEGRGYSSYNTENRKIFLDSETASRNIVHELGHAFGAMLNLYEDPEFLRIIAKGLDLQDWGRVAIGKHPSDGSTIFYYKDSSKFIFPYQGRLYAHPDSIGKGNIDPACFREYISVGFDLYFHRPKILKTRDPDLYHYLEVLINGFTDSSNEGAN